MAIFFNTFPVASERWVFLDGHCYDVIPETAESYDEAMEICAAHGGYVAATTLPAEMNIIRDISKG